MDLMRRHARNLALVAAALPLVAGHPRHASSKGSQKTYIYTYLDANGHLVINNLPPATCRGGACGSRR